MELSVKPLTPQETVTKLMGFLEGRDVAHFRLGSTYLVLTKGVDRVHLHGSLAGRDNADVVLNSAGEVTYGDTLKLNPFKIAAQLRNSHEVK